MTGVQLIPVDTWFFRGSVPFTSDSAPQENVESLFPPHPPTVVGAIRAALALRKGWSGRGRWPREICDVLGDGYDDLGMLSLDGPFLLRDGQPLFPAPRHLLGSSDGAHWHPKVLLKPGYRVICDLGDVRLPQTQGNQAIDEGLRLKTGNRHWLTLDGMNAVLRGWLPHSGDVVPSECLWSDEMRVGLERDNNSRTAKEGMLYSTRHVRLRRGITLGVRIVGLPQDWKLPFDQLLSLGGENRLAECRQWKSDLAIETHLSQIKETGKVAVIALSPINLEQDICLGRKPLNALGNARVVSACLDRPQRIGGWDSLKRRSLPLRSVLPPGSVLFCKIPDPEHFEDAITAGDGLTHVGSRQRWGFGLVAIGSWPTKQIKSSS